MLFLVVKCVRMEHRGEIWLNKEITLCVNSCKSQSRIEHQRAKGSRFRPSFEIRSDLDPGAEYIHISNIQCII